MLHYNHSQYFQAHWDYFDPATDPIQNFKVSHPLVAACPFDPWVVSIKWRIALKSELIA